MVRYKSTPVRWKANARVQALGNIRASRVVPVSEIRGDGLRISPRPGLSLNPWRYWTRRMESRNLYPRRGNRKRRFLWYRS